MPHTAGMLDNQRFQFHKGTIRTLLRLLIQMSLFQFQFHKGTIRTLLRLLIQMSLFQFQFHKGTIRTR